VTALRVVRVKLLLDGCKLIRLLPFGAVGQLGHGGTRSRATRRWRHDGLGELDDGEATTRFGVGTLIVVEALRFVEMTVSESCPGFVSNVENGLEAAVATMTESRDTETSDACVGRHGESTEPCGAG
jgi:hypothetical protein